MSTPVAIGVGVAVGAAFVVLLQAAFLWLYCKHAERASTKTTLSAASDLELTRPIPAITRS